MMPGILIDTLLMTQGPQPWKELFWTGPWSFKNEVNFFLVD